VKNHGNKMFIINLTYTVKLETIDKYLAAHLAYLEKQFSRGVFITSGKKVPRTGGIILSNAENKKVLLKILDEDPFKINRLAEYQIIEFTPSMGQIF